MTEAKKKTMYFRIKYSKTAFLLLLFIFTAARFSLAQETVEEEGILDYLPAILAAAPNTDNDGDGYSENQGDCNDANSAISPVATEICGDGIDQDCSGAERACMPEEIDDDGDGFTENQGDCNDLDATIYSGATEICSDGIDQDCSGADLLCPYDIDDDGDGFTENLGDCDDSSVSIYPRAVEICGDGIDQDCSSLDKVCPVGQTDFDDDGDNFTEDQGDCNDGDNFSYPGAPEIPFDGIDQDCSGEDYPVLSTCSDGPIFTQSVMDADKINFIVPLGNIGGHIEPTDHHYFIGKTPSDPLEEIDLFAPADMTTYSILIQTQINDGEEPKEDYGIRAYVCSDLKVDIGHISKMTQDILDQIDFSKADCSPWFNGAGYTMRQCFIDTPVSILAGQKIGTVAQNNGWAIDLGVSDQREVVYFISPEKVPAFGDMIHKTCFTNYLIEPYKSELLSLMGNNLGNDEIVFRTAEPICGDIEQDIPGTAQGLWYLEPWEENIYNDVFFALAHDNVDPTVPAFSIGFGIESITRGVYYFEPLSTGNINADFDRVRPDGTVYCYEFYKNSVFVGDGWGTFPNDMHILIQMPSEKELLITGAEGTSCESNFQMPEDATLLVR